MKAVEMELTDTLTGFPVNVRDTHVNLNSTYDDSAVVNANEAELELEVYKKQIKFLTYLNAFIKRIMDICGAIVGILLLIPITIIVAIANWISGDFGPLFYSQERIGKNGKHFKFYKFRSMVVNADEKLEELLKNDENAREEWENNHKLKNDPRITKVGNFIRKTSIDEIPQFINVLKGDMSLVGPRPYMPKEKEDMGEYYNIIVKNKPGLTGYWQVSGRSNVSFEDRLDMDVKYYKLANFGLDMKLLFRTVNNVLKKEGAS